MIYNTRFVLVSVLAVLAVACSDDAAQQAAAPNAPAAQQVSSATPTPAATTADPHRGLSRDSGAATVTPKNLGRVINAEHSGPYSYLEVQVNGGSFWLAASRSDVAPGDVVRWGDGAVMQNFHSKALGRTFEQIVFVSQVVPAAVPGTAQEKRTTGKVVSVAHAAGYSYVEVEGGTWLAAPITEVAAGNTVSWSGGAAMQNFSSNALDKVFDEILFVGALRVTQ